MLDFQKTPIKRQTLIEVYTSAHLTPQHGLVVHFQIRENLSNSKSCVATLMTNDYD